MTGQSFNLSGIGLNDLAVWRAVPIEIPPGHRCFMCQEDIVEDRDREYPGLWRTVPPYQVPFLQPIHGLVSVLLCYYCVHRCWEEDCEQIRAGSQAGPATFNVMCEQHSREIRAKGPEAVAAYLYDLPRCAII